MASPPPGPAASRVSTHRCERYLPCQHKGQQRWGGVSTDTRSSQAQYVSRTALDTGREGRLLRPIRAPPSPGHAAQPASQGATAAQLSSHSISAGNEVQARVRPAGRGGIPKQPSSPGGAPPRAAYFGAHGRSVARPRSCWSQRQATPPCTISQPRRPARRAGRAGRPRLFGGCLGRLLLAVRPPKVPRVPLRADLPLRGPHAHLRGAQIHPPLAPTAARRYSSGRQPMHLIDERPPEPRRNRGMALIAVQASLHP